MQAEEDRRYHTGRADATKCGVPLTGAQLKLIATVQFKEEVFSPIARQAFKSLQTIRFREFAPLIVKRLDIGLRVTYHAPLHPGLSVLPGNMAVN